MSGGVLLLGLLSVAAAEEPCLIAHYTFDEGSGDVVKDHSGNGNDGKIHGAVYVKSPRGHALEFDPAKKSYVDCGTKPVMNVSGDLTVEAWVKLDMSAVKGDRYIFGDTASLAVNRNFYVSASNGRLRMEHGNGKANSQLVSDQEVFTGQWQHVAMMCEYPYFQIYVDGREVMFGEMSIPITPTGITPRHIGGWWYEPGQFKGRIDEIRVYNGALPESTILEHAGLKGEASKTELKRVLATVHYPTQKVVVQTICQNVTGAGSLSVWVLDKNGAKVQWRDERVEQTRPGSGRAVVKSVLEAAGDGTALLPGDYVVRVALQDAQGKQIAVSQDVSLTYPQKPPWYGCREGLSDKVLPPYTDIQVTKDHQRVAVGVWGRTYRFADTPFLAGVESQGKSLLAGPMRVTAEINGKPVNWVPRPWQTTRETPAKTQLCQELAGGDVTLVTEAEIEFDGLARFYWRIKTATRARIDRMFIDLPFDPAVAKYVYSWSSLGVDTNNGYLAKQPASFAFRPMIWFGDEERGMQWVAESDRNWSPAAPDKAMEIIKGDNEVVLRLNIVGQEVVIDPARPMPDYTFALAATPLKPIEKDHWEMRFHHISQTTHGPVDMRLNVPDEILDKLAAGGVKTVCFHEHWTQCQAYSSTPFEADLDSFVKRCHQRGMKVLLYFGFNISDLIPEWPYIGEDCVVHPKSGYLPSNYPPQPIQNAYIVCLNSAYQDLLADGVARLVDRFDIDGVYLDTTTVPFACCNEAHGCGYRKPDGTLVSTFPVFSVRQMLRRMYTIIRQRKPDGLVDAHVYDGMTAPALAWATSYWTGEQLRRTENYAEGMPLDRFRAECMGRNWGVPAEFLYYMLGSYRNGYALALLHDVEVRPAGLKEDFELGKSVWKVMDDFGRKQSQWYPYWSNQEYVKVSVADCYASLYHHPTNGVLVVVSNLGGKEAAIELTLNREKLGLAGTLTTKDALTGQHVDAVQGTVTTKLPSVGWQMIWVKP